MFSVELIISLLLLKLFGGGSCGELQRAVPCIFFRVWSEHGLVPH